MATVSRGTTYGATETITNTKLHNLVDLASVSQIVNADCSASMNLVDTKLADITTSNKVRGTALGNLASISSGAGIIPTANMPVMGATHVSLASIPNTALVPISLTSWVDGSSMRNIQSMPSLAGQLAWYSIVSSLASGGIPIYNGTTKFIGGSKYVPYSAGDYPLNIIPIGSIGSNDVGNGSSSYTNIVEMVIPRGGTLRIKYFAWTKGGGFNSNTKIYRNGVAVGTENTASSTTAVEFSEDISGWEKGDLLQIYGKYTPADGPSAVAGGLRLFSGDPTTEVATTAFQRTYRGNGTPNSGVGSIGDLYIDTTGGASTTLYVKTGASTWTAK